MSKNNKQKSRRATPWKGKSELTATQEFLKRHYDTYYADRHRKLDERGETEMINSYIPGKCPYCEAEKYKKSGYSKNGIQRYMCSECGKTFLPTTGTIFDEHRISISEWMEYSLNLFRHDNITPETAEFPAGNSRSFERDVRITADSWSNKNDFKTSRYWLAKLFLTLEGVQDNIVLSEKVWLDETFYTVRSEDIVHKDNGDKLRGLSRNQICIGVATDKQHTILFSEGTGSPSQKKTVETFMNHIQQGSKLIHDDEFAHRKLVKELNLESVVYASKDLKGLSDKKNPLNPVNSIHAILKRFLYSHSSFDRDDIQGYLNLFAFVTNPPNDMLEKVELVVKMAFQNPRLLRFRDFYASKPDF